jgi:hypothetical protein
MSLLGRFVLKQYQIIIKSLISYYFICDRNYLLMNTKSMISIHTLHVLLLLGLFMHIKT